MVLPICVCTYVMGNPYVKSYQISKEMNKNKNNDIEFTSKNKHIVQNTLFNCCDTHIKYHTSKLKSLKTLYCRLYIISMVSIINQMMNDDEYRQLGLIHATHTSY